MEMSEIIEVLDYLGEKVGVTIDWTSDNVLPYLNLLAEKYIRYEISTSIVWIVVGLIVVVTSIIFVYKAAKVYDDYKYTDVADIIITLGVIVAIFGFIIICHQVLDIIKCCTIPEMMIFDYLRTIKR